jgi:teichuronic acid biosynthesis glycosyltransferase TuaH
MDCWSSAVSRSIDGSHQLKPGFIVLGAELPWIHPLAVELGRLCPTVGISLGASFSLRRRRPPLPFDAGSSRATFESWTYPPGFNGKLAPLFTRSIRARVNRTVRRIEAETGEAPFVVIPDPGFLPYVTDVTPGRLIYLNYDDYSGAGPSAVRNAEIALVQRAGTILCSSQYQTMRFKRKFPDRQHDIFHLPHGVHESFINADPATFPDATSVCSVGYLSSRYDWELIEQVVRALPDIRFTFVGDIVTRGNNGQRSDWVDQMDATLKLPNVLHIPGLKHRETASHYWKSAANWMPYKADITFVKASCPLKLTDGLASGRPVISADIPECRLYPEWVRVYGGAGDAADSIRRAVAGARTSEAAARARAQIAFARKNTWASRADSLVAITERL